jgi:hypothetical protein
MNSQNTIVRKTPKGRKDVSDQTSIRPEIWYGTKDLMKTFWK